CDTEALPLHGEHAVTLQVTERAVVAHELEAVVGTLERATWTVPPVAPITDVRGQERDTVLVPECPHPPGRFPLATAQVGETGCHQDLLFSVGVEVEQGDLGFRLVVARRRIGLGPEPRHQTSRPFTR